MDRPSRSGALRAVRTLISYIGDNPEREGLQDTPERVLRAWETDWGDGYRERTPSELLKMFSGNDIESTAYNQMVIVRDITFFSHCEHHLTPFFGQAHIAYLPSGAGLAGLSKLARVLDHFARRLQVQERLTEQVADFLEAHLSESCGVMLEATHLCMVSRGVQQPHARTITTALRGELLDDSTARGEFLAAIRSK